MLRKLREAARIVLVYALLGLVASVAVAWGLAAVIDVSSRQNEQTRAFNEDDLLNIPGGNYRSLSMVVRSQLRSFGSYRRSLQMPLIFGEMPLPLLHLSSAASWIPEGFDIKPFLEVVEPDNHLLPQWTYAIPHHGSWGKAYKFDLERQASKIDILEDARGFPVLCLWNEWQVQPNQSLAAVGGIALPDRNPGAATPPPALLVRALPYRPIWAGLAFNTVFYALLFWLLVRLATGLRAWRRFSKGLCTKCAYDLLFDYSRGCSECGWGKQRNLQRSQVS